MITAEQFPRGGALLLSLMGGAGMLSVAVVLPIMGARVSKRWLSRSISLGNSRGSDVPC